MINNTMAALPIHITPHHLSLSPTLRDFVCMKLAKIPRFASDVLAADLVLRRHHGRANGKQFSASARLALPGRDIHGSATHADLYSAIVQLVATLVRRARKRSTRLAKTYTQRTTNREVFSSANPSLSTAIHPRGSCPPGAMNDATIAKSSNQSRDS